MSTADRVLTVVADQLRTPREKLTRETTFDSLQVDSLAAVELAIELEGEFGVMIPDDAMAGSATVGQLVDAIERLLVGGVK